MLQYCSDKTWDLARDYQFTGDWSIESVLTNHLGVIVGIGEYDPTTGTLLQRIKELTVGELITPTVGQAGSFTLSVSSFELQAAGVSATSRVGVFLHHDNDGVLYQSSSAKNDVYRVDNLFMRFFGGDVDSDGDGIPDAEETAAGLDPDNAADGTEDADSDGMTNAGEYLVGTDMNDSNDLLKVYAAVNSSIPEVILPAAHILANRLYILEHKQSLITSDPWRSIDAVSGTVAGGTGDYVFQCPDQGDQAFFRIRAEWE